MSFYSQDEIHDLYIESKDDAKAWRKDYHEFERLADNDLKEDLDESLPEVNDGSLAASLFKLPKRVVSRKLKGRSTAPETDDAWITELANIRWEKKIIPNANSQAKFYRKWKDAVRKAAIYGGQPLITLFVSRGNYTGADFIVPQAQDVTLEAGKVSDEDSDVIFWDVYYSKKQVRDMIEQAKNEKDNSDGYNKWDIEALEEILASKQEEERDSQEEHNKKGDKAVKKSGFHFYVAFQRGVEAPFSLTYTSTKKTVREWSNPDPSGDVPVHYLYCYQDFVNPYGIGIVKLAGGTQNVLDHMRQSDVLATDIGIAPPVKVEGNEEDVDLESIVYAKNALWFTGEAKVDPIQIANGVYEQLPNRIAMYKTSLNQLIPTGDTSISSAAGDPNYSKTPQGVKFQQSNLSIDDEDFKDNLYETYASVAQSMINTDFANMQGTDLLKLSDEEREILQKSGLEFPTDEDGNPTNELEIIWDEARAIFDFEADPDQDKAQDDEKRLDGLLKVAEIRKGDPTFDASMQASGKRLNVGELYSEIIALTTDSKKIIEDISPEEMQQSALAQVSTGQEQTGQDGGAIEPEPYQGEPADQNNAEAQTVMERFGVDESTALFMLEADKQGFGLDEILAAIQRQGVQNA